MGLFSKFGKNKQETADQDSGYYTSADDQAATERARSKRASSADGPPKGRGRGGKEREADDPVLPEKKRARRRLVGAIALALTVAIVLPMVLDSEPKPLASDIDIKIPSKDKATDPVTPPAAPAAVAAKVADSAALDSSEEIVSDVKPGGKGAKAGAAVVAAAPLALKASPAITAPPAVAELKVGADSAKVKDSARDDLKAVQKADAKLAEAKADTEAKAKAKVDTEAKAKADAKAEAKFKADAIAKNKADAKVDSEAKAKAKIEDARALAILEGKAAAKLDAKPAAADGGHKFVLQVAALTDQAKIDELRDKLKKAGIGSFTEKAPSGYTRIRVGPFSSKEEAEKVRARLADMHLDGRLEAV